MHLPRFAYEAQRSSLGVQTRPNDGHDIVGMHIFQHMCSYALIYASSNCNALEYTCIVSGYATV